jgi:hypothetical protein
MILDILPFWGLAVACYMDGEYGKALLVAIIGPAIVLLDATLREIKNVRP